MEISIDETSVMAIQQLGTMALDEVSDFIYAVEAAPSIKALMTIYDDVELTEGRLTFLAKTNAQHVAVSVQVEVNEKGEAVLTVKHYD